MTERNPEDEHKKNMFKEALDDVLKTQVPKDGGNMAYYDSYLGKTKFILQQNGNEKYHGNAPELVTINGIQPCILRGDELRYHAKGNLVLTSVAINRMKYMNLAADLAHLQEYLDGPPTEERQAELIRKCNQTLETTALLPPRLIQRLHEDVSVEEMRFRTAEWSAGKRVAKLSKNEEKKVYRIGSNGAKSDSW